MPRELVVEVDGLFDEAETENVRIKVDVPLGITDDAGEMVDAGRICEHRMSRQWVFHGGSSSLFVWSVDLRQIAVLVV